MSSTVADEKPNSIRFLLILYVVIFSVERLQITDARREFVHLRGCPNFLYFESSSA
jgi:hypothetical protein